MSQSEGVATPEGSLEVERERESEVVGRGGGKKVG